MTRVCGVILAGGRAARMGGGDKGLLALGAGCVMDHVIDRLGSQTVALAINANGDPARFAQFGLPVLCDSVPDYPGPLAGILAGMDWAATLGAAQVVTAAADTPFFPRDLVARLGAAAGPTGISLAASADGGGVRLHPTFGLWPVALRGQLRAALLAGMRRVGQWAEENGAQRAEFDARGRDPFFNINTPEDLAQARAMGGWGPI